MKKYKFDVVFLDQTYGKDFNNGGHLNEFQVKEIVKAMKEQNIINEKSQIFATHISHEGNNIHSIMGEKASLNGYHVAYDGMEINV